MHLSIKHYASVREQSISQEVYPSFVHSVHKRTPGKLNNSLYSDILLYSHYKPTKISKSILHLIKRASLNILMIGHLSSS
jgi:hypothetical protein